MRSIGVSLRAGYIFVFLLLLPLKNFAIEVVIATGVNTDPPYVYGNEIIEDREFPGITIEVLKMIEEKTDIHFIIKKMPWSRVVYSVKKNELDGGFHFSYKPERSSFVAYPIHKDDDLPDPRYSLHDRSYFLYSLNDEYADGLARERLSNKKRLSNQGGRLLVGVIRGSSISSHLVKLGYDLEEVSHDLQLPMLLLKGRIDAYAGLQNMHDAKLEMLEPELRSAIKKAPQELSRKPYYIVFSKKFYQNNTAIVWEIWNVISEIKHSGELNDLYLKYMLKNK